MSADIDLDYDEELDAEFLEFYREPRATMTDLSPILKEDDDDDEERSLEESLLLNSVNRSGESQRQRYITAAFCNRIHKVPEKASKGRF